MDRHIDQIIMCAIYVMAKVNHERKENLKIIELFVVHVSGMITLSFMSSWYKEQFWSTHIYAFLSLLIMSHGWQM